MLFNLNNYNNYILFSISDFRVLAELFLRPFTPMDIDPPVSIVAEEKNYSILQTNSCYFVVIQ